MHLRRPRAACHQRSVLLWEELWSDVDPGDARCRVVELCLYSDAERDCEWVG